MAVSLFRTTVFKTEAETLRRFTWTIKDRNGKRYLAGFYTINRELFYRGSSGDFVRKDIPDYLEAKAFCKRHLFRVLGGARRAEMKRQRGRR